VSRGAVRKRRQGQRGKGEEKEAVGNSQQSWEWKKGRAGEREDSPEGGGGANLEAGQSGWTCTEKKVIEKEIRRERESWGAAGGSAVGELEVVYRKFLRRKLET